MQANRRTVIAALLVSAGMLLPGLAQAQKAPPAPTYPPSVGQLVASTKKQIKTIKMDEFRAALDRKELGLIVDVREEDEYDRRLRARRDQHPARPHRVPHLEARSASPMPST